MARPKLPERTSLNIYLTKRQKEWLLKEARAYQVNPSILVRQWIDLAISVEKSKQPVIQI